MAKAWITLTKSSSGAFLSLRSALSVAREGVRYLLITDGREGETQIKFLKYIRRSLMVLSDVFFRGAESLLNQGLEWEKKGEYNRAIDMYMKITPSMTTDHELVEDAMVKVSGPDTS